VVHHLWQFADLEERRARRAELERAGLGRDGAQDGAAHSEDEQQDHDADAVERDQLDGRDTDIERGRRAVSRRHGLLRMALRSHERACAEPRIMDKRRDAVLCIVSATECEYMEMACTLAAYEPSFEFY